MNGFRYGSRSLKILAGINPDLRDVCMRALEISPRDIGVLDGLRTIEQQRHYVETGKSKTMNSRHLTGHAVDLAVYVDRRIVWEPWEVYEDLAETMFQAAHLEGMIIEWGGFFCRQKSDGSLRVFRDGPHFQLPRAIYPDAVGSAVT